MMACAAVHTGQRFMAEALIHIDCQAQTIGAYGYGALADPGSALAIALTSLFTVFVALFGLRLMLGEPVGGRDLIGGAVRIGVVLTLASSWPAWRTLGYDVVMKGPGELAATLGTAADVPGQRGDMIARLQAADDGIVLLTVQGTGRNTGGTDRSNTIGDSFRGVALADQEGFADGRIAFLAGILAPLALVRIGSGLLLALAPLMAGLLLFAGTRDVFFGWLRGLAALALGALALSLLHGVELALLEPWLRDALALRDAQVLTPSVPTELVVITVTFAIAAFGMLALIARIVFFGGFGLPRLFASLPAAAPVQSASDLRAVVQAGPSAPPSRAFVVAEAVVQTMRREDRTSGAHRITESASLTRGAARDPLLTSGLAFEPLGSSYRASESRRFRRSSAASAQRDNRA